MNLRYQSKIYAPITLVAILLIGYLDYLSGFMLSLFPLYLVPLLIVAWHDRRSITILMSCIAGVILIVKDTMLKFAAPNYGYWDELIKFALLMAISYGVWEIRELIHEKDSINNELRRALSEIKELREMIPICAWCHSIRNDKGFYERIEVYLSQLTGAKFTHGICPACMEKHYGIVHEQMEREKAERSLKK